eukprot:TRINITY_DN104770_c0_g1_i1.p1 TRINITY_DN104770_c0_g1~~TRINITY_DN104770_c0_g1_i1.p1  ORF type:complete len:860 (-),score=114.13 TRINITY_DN104770_c0_g1_i1:445-3024(-)
MLLLSLLSTLLAVGIPNGIVVGAFSVVGPGFRVYNYFTESWMRMAGAGGAAFCLLWLALLYVVDFGSLHPLLQVPLGSILVAAAFGTALCRVMLYPWAAMALCCLLSVALLAQVRTMICRKAPAKTFLMASSISYGCCAICILTGWVIWTILEERLWKESTRVLLARESQAYTFFSRDFDYELNYTVYCGPDQSSFINASSMSLDDQELVISRCSKANLVWFVQYWGPVAMAIADLAAAAFAAGFARSLKSKALSEGDIRISWREAVAPDGQTYYWNVETKETRWDKPQISRQSAAGDSSKISEIELKNLKSLIKRCSYIIIVAVAALYGSQYVAGASVSLGGVFASCAAITLAAVVGYMFTEVDHKLLQALTSDKSLGKSAVAIMKSDWVRAMGVGALNILIPFIVVLDVLRMRMRRCRGKVSADNTEKFTPAGRLLVDELSTWYWTGIFAKVNLLAKVAVILLVFMKLTYIFFSWLNVEIGKSGWEFWKICLMCAAIDLAMFLNPLVPGTAVYLFNGVVLGSQSQVSGSVGFWPGYAISSGISLVCKLIACVGQYTLGAIAGRFVKVQQFVGVDKVSTRAMEKLLKGRGLGLGKVCILVAGPDFPTSMLCGILKINIPQMILGTLPVFIVTIAPQVLVGALLVYSGGQKNTWSAVSLGVTSAALVFQLAATFIFTAQIMKTVEKDEEELSKPREEHNAVAELTRQEAVYNQAYRRATEWGAMSCAQKSLLLISVGLYLLVGFVLVADYSSPAYDKFCFRSFEITSKIDNSFELRGLNGNALNIVMPPAGWIALGVALCAEMLDFIFGKCMKCAARTEMDRVSKLDDLDDGTTPVVPHAAVPALAPADSTVADAEDTL